MRGGIFIGISAAAGVAFVFACGSFGEGAGASGDGGGSDGAVASDAPASDGGLTTLGQRCTGRVRLYDAFDRALPGAANEWNLAPDAGLVLLADSGVPPPAMFASAPIFDDGGGRNDVMTRGFDLEGEGSVCIEVDVFFEVVEGAFTGKAYGEILAVRAPNTANFFVEFGPTGVELTQGGTPAPVSTMAPGKWQHLVLRIPYGTNEHATVEVDGTASASGYEPPGPVPPDLDVDLGLETNSRTDKTAAVRVYLDNFRLTTAR